MFHREVSKYIEERQLLARSEGVLVALSGGADSVALLRVLLALGYRCEAAHCNFQLRGAESARDEAFVRQLCCCLEVPLSVIHFDTIAYAAERGLSIEMAARELRYDWFEQVRIRQGLAAIAVAHHRDDSVETFLLNLLRGAGINGLKGITPRNGRVVRPLLEQSRADILHYLERLHQDYVTDTTNLQDEYLRNKIRLHVLPLLSTLNPSAVRSISEAANRLSDAALIYNKVIDDARQRLLEPVESAKGGEAFRIAIADLLKETAPSAVLFELLHPFGFNSMQIHQVFRSLSAQSGKRFVSATWEVLRDRESLLLRLREDGEDTAVSGNLAGVSEEMPSSQPALVVQTDHPPRLHVRLVERTAQFVMPRNKTVACLDADSLAFPLTLRRWQAGDKFVPFGMTGKKKVSDYLTDRKFSLFRKEQQCVLCAPDGRIVWLVGERPDNRFRVTERTTRLLLIELLDD